MDSMTATFKNIDGTTFKAERRLERGCPFQISRLDPNEGWVYCGELTKYTPASIRDSLRLTIGEVNYCASFAR